MAATIFLAALCIVITALMLARITRRDKPPVPRVAPSKPFDEKTDSMEC